VLEHMGRIYTAIDRPSRAISVLKKCLKIAR
jgi:hypothetical protein